MLVILDAPRPLAHARRRQSATDQAAAVPSARRPSWPTSRTHHPRTPRANPTWHHGSSLPQRSYRASHRAIQAAHRDRHGHATPAAAPQEALRFFWRAIGHFFAASRRHPCSHATADRSASNQITRGVASAQAQAQAQVLALPSARDLSHGTFFLRIAPPPTRRAVTQAVQAGVSHMACVGGAWAWAMHRRPLGK